MSIISAVFPLPTIMARGGDSPSTPACDVGIENSSKYFSRNCEINTLFLPLFIANFPYKSVDETVFYIT
ncbi:MAG: hypothetical protein ABL857_07065, partial [Rickettsiales bacterium]